VSKLISHLRCQWCRRGQTPCRGRPSQGGGWSIGQCQALCRLQAQTQAAGHC